MSLGCGSGCKWHKLEGQAQVISVRPCGEGKCVVWEGGPSPGLAQPFPARRAPPEGTQELWELGGWWAALSCSSLEVEHLARRVYSVPTCTQEARSCRGSGFIYGRQEASGWGSCCSPLLPGTRLSPCSLAS